MNTEAIEYTRTRLLAHWDERFTSFVMMLQAPPDRVALAHRKLVERFEFAAVHDLEISLLEPIDLIPLHWWTEFVNLTLEGLFLTMAFEGASVE